jgi:hypothetical protein
MPWRSKWTLLEILSAAVVLRLYGPPVWTMVSLGSSWPMDSPPVVLCMILMIAFSAATLFSEPTTLLRNFAISAAAALVGLTGVVFVLTGLVMILGTGRTIGDDLLSGLLSGITDIAFTILVFPFLALLPVPILRLYRMFRARGAS